MVGMYGRRDCKSRGISREQGYTTSMHVFAGTTLRGAGRKVDIPSAFNDLNRSLLAREVVLCKQNGVKFLKIR